MNYSPGKDEGDKKSEHAVDFIAYNLLEKAIKRGVWGSVLKKIRTNIFHLKPKKQICECKFKPKDGERRALILLPSKPKEWFETVLVDASKLEHENIIKIYGRTCVHSVNGIVTEWLGSIDAKKQKYGTYVGIGPCCLSHNRPCCAIHIPCRWISYLRFGSCFIPVPSSICSSCQYIDDDVRFHLVPPPNTVLATPGGSISLKEVIQDIRDHSLGDILQWNIQIIQALEYVNKSFGGQENERFRRYFNRILCPQNMILDPSRKILKICALGLHKEIPDPKDFDPEEQEELYYHLMHLEDVQRELSIQRKINYSYYWAPEVWNGEYRYEESDVYSFGVVLWECITGKEPIIRPRQKTISLDRFKSNSPFKTSSMFQRFIDQCTLKEPSKDRPSVSVIKTILENMVAPEEKQDWNFFKKDIISFWGSEDFHRELYYCKKLFSFGSSPINNADEQIKQVSTVFNYGSMEESFKELGSGAFGKVYSAEYEGKTVAVKFQGAMKMYPFLQEFSVLNQLEHENIVKVIGQTEEVGVYGIVMEFIDGTSLHKIIHGTSNYTLGDVLKWNYQAASALDYMHSFRCLHRDIKPDNILIENSDKQTLKIIDLGGAKKIKSSMNRTGMGTESYMAPEIYAILDNGSSDTVYSNECDIHSWKTNNLSDLDNSSEMSKESDSCIFYPPRRQQISYRDSKPKAENKNCYNEQCDVYSWTITFWECLTADRPQRPPDYRSKVSQICSAKFVEVMEKCSNSNPSLRKPMFVIKKWLGDMLNNRKEFTDTDSTFRENHICVWNEQTHELYHFGKTINANSESEESSDVFAKAKSSSSNAPMDAFKIIRDLADESGHVKLIKAIHPELIPCTNVSHEISRTDIEYCRYEKRVPRNISSNSTDYAQLKGYSHCHSCDLSDGLVLKFSKNDAVKKYVENEFVILSKLNHENIVKLFGYTHDMELNYFGIITKYFMYSETLEKAITDGHYITKTILQYGLETARGLEYMHSRNILHCDIKPAHILVTTGLHTRCQIYGFELSRDLQYEHPKEVVGTGIYMAPEVRRDGLLTTKSDVYSWTVTFWQLCKFVATDFGKPVDIKIEELKRMESIDLCEARKAYRIENGSDKFNEFIQACANKDPDKRRSMADIATLLEDMMNSRWKSHIDIDNINIQADKIVRNDICLWTIDPFKDRLTKDDFFYASLQFSLDLQN